jgi:hypothetical protein
MKLSIYLFIMQLIILLVHCCKLQLQFFVFTTSSQQFIPEESVDGQDWDCLRGRDVTDDVVAAALSPDEDDGDAEVAAALSPITMED